MNNKPSLAKSLYQIASLVFYFAALGFFATAIIANNLIYSPIGASFMCIGTLFLVLSKRKGKRDEDSGK